jgi:hypothetical protein
MSEEQRPEAKEPIREPAQERHDPTVGRSPDFKVQYGRVQAAVWSREIEGRTIFSVSLSRSYRDRQDQWQRTTNLDEEDLLPAGIALSDAYKWIQQQRQHQRDGAFHELQTPPRAGDA